LPLARRAVALAATAGDTSSVAYADALATVAVQFHNQNRVPEALAAMPQAIAALHRIGRGSTLPMLDALVDEARFLWALERLVQSLAARGSISEARARLAQLSAMIPEDDRASLGLLEALIAEATGDPGHAYRAYVHALTELGFPDDPHVPPWHRMVYRAARAALASGDPGAADSLTRHAVRLEGELGHDTTRSSDIGLALVILARARATRGDSAGAREALEQAIGPLEYGLGREDARVWEVRRLLAQGGRP
jgi:tetratricopeptide (TPR) repeat protein